MAVLLLVSAAAVAVAVAIGLGGVPFLHYVTKTGPSSLGPSQPLLSFPSLSLGPAKLVTVGLLVAPLLGLPLLAREERWAVAPYFTYLPLASATVFFFPFQYQYELFVVPGLFAATVRGLERIRGWGDRPSPMPAPAGVNPSAPVRRWSLPRPDRTAGGLAILAIIVAGSVFAPWGPLNARLRDNSTLAPGWYNFGLYDGTNATIDAHIRTLMASIPSHGPVLTQTNLPEPLGRAYYTFPSRFSPQLPIVYLVTDPYAPAFYFGRLNGPGTTPMIAWANYYLAQGWGVLGEADGALLLAANYSGPPKVYFPLEQAYAGPDFPCCGWGLTWSNLTSGTWVGGPRWPIEGAYATLSPGTFAITASFLVDHPSAQGRIHLTATANHSAVRLLNATFSGAAWASSSGLVNVTYDLTVRSYLPDPYFAISCARWTGPLTFVGLRMEQIAPPVPA